MREIIKSALGTIAEYGRRSYYIACDFFRRSTRAMSISRRTLLTVSAFLTIWYSALQVKGACGALSPMQCLVTPLAWASPKLFGRLEAWARPAPKEEISGTTPVSLIKPPSTSGPSGTKPVGPAEVKRPPAPQIAPQRQRMISVANRGRQNVTYFWASACSDTNWGGDRLGTREVIPYGYQRTFDLYDGTDNCCFDLRVRFANGQQDTARNIDVCRVRSWTVSTD
jgi:hypothetical protein